MFSVDISLEIHPASWRARLARKLRSFRYLRGWGRVLKWLVPSRDAGPFVVSNRGTLFAGDLSSFIDRQMYLIGEYEGLEIEQFLDVVRSRRRCVLLDIGANVGTHSLRFAREFQFIHAFEPNGLLWRAFERNVELNKLRNVKLHRIGLGEADAELPFYAIDSQNQGLGTFLHEEQYDKPLKCIGGSCIVNGDKYLREQGVGPIDAIKVDVQGFEAAVLRGLRETLQSSQPVVWFEYGQGTRASSDGNSLRALFPYEIRLFQMTRLKVGAVHRMRLTAVGHDIPLGNYIAVPKS